MLGYIPYGAYWSTPFARWQGSLSHLHAVKFAAYVAKGALLGRGISHDQIDFCAYGMTVIQPNCFYGTPWFSAMMGADRLPGPTVTQACATGARLIATAIGEFSLGAECALVVSGDRTSNGAHIYYPAPQGPGGTGQAEDWVMDNFNTDPWAGCAMVDTAENVAVRLEIGIAEQHDLVLHRHAQYAQSLTDNRAFQKRYMAAGFEVPDVHFQKTIAVMDGDEGIYPVDAGKIATLRPLRPGGTVTFAGQTHPADGNAGMIVTRDVEKAHEIAGVGAPKIEILSVTQAREEKGFMPAAPILASRKALQQVGFAIDDLSAIKSHNPFAVNDIAFARAFEIDWRNFNNYGSSLIWGHPQGPTGLRGIIELIEELVLKGGGTGLFQGCAAGDSAMAVIVRVT
ncbi:thiolase family protein [Pseudopelagicola sp. nBUS_19]|uniref:thiolase family protein n=1 Tax=unclassified Pseudopelagicola TaxID=2649563 RepID=UPI003EBE8E88